MLSTGERIRRIRRSKNMTQENVASSLNISQRAYSKIENDEVSLKVERLQEIADILETDISELLPNQVSQSFENVSYSQIGNGKFIHQSKGKESELYEKIIARQQEEIDYLKGIIEVLKN
ncbi:hypothetical protein GCM10009118_24410 [Wandonia haliotis]|uniref:HTH cro/C1-type domain-containing protein n=1 Tax=Wandonia haliotis TaxID=574963 RepID=A0ABP3Y3E4_9FLAO